MNIKYIKIGDIELYSQAGEPFSFDGLFSNQTLSGINLKLEKLNESAQTKIENLLKEKTIDVEDPFTQRKYQAEIVQRSSSFTVGIEGKSYQLEVKEIDKIPNFKQLEINGVAFDLLEYRERLTSDTITRQGVLKLSQEQYESFRNLLSEKTLKVRRLGVDDEAMELRFGSRMFWSKHKEDDKTYYKHIFRLFELTLKASNLDMASGVILDNAARLLIRLSSNTEELINILKNDTSLSEKTIENLDKIGARSFVSDEYIDNLLDSLEEVIDAEELLA